MQLPALPSSLTSFLQRRRSTLLYTVTTLGGIYCAGRYAMRKISEFAEVSARSNAEAANLEKRFNSNLLDCQFTVQALLPTVSSQILEEMDVEGLSAQLIEESRRLKAEKEAEKSKEQQEVTVVVEDPPEEEVLQPKVGGLGLNPAASVFVPGLKSPRVEETPTFATQQEEVRDQIPVVQIDLDSSFLQESTASLPPPALGESSLLPTEQEPVLSKSWAQVVVDGAGHAEELETKVVEVRPTRGEIWNDIKILSFTRTITAIYVLTLLTLQTHVQLNLLGRSNYLSSVLSPSAPSPDASSPTLEVFNEEIDLSNGEDSNYVDSRPMRKGEVGKETERMFLTFSWWLLHEGWKDVAARVRVAVEDIVGPMSLKETVSYGELSTLLGKIRQKIDLNDDATLYSFSASLFPSTPSAEFQTLSSGGLPPSSYSAGLPAQLRELLNETQEFLDCSDGALVRKLCLDTLFGKLAGECEGAFSGVVGLEEGEGSRFEDVTERTVRLAGLLPSVARQSHLVLNGLPNTYVEVLEGLRELNEFSAIVYSSFDKEQLQ